MSKSIVGIISVILGIVVVGAGIMATVPQARVALSPVAQYVPAIGPAAGLSARVEGPSMSPEFTNGSYVAVLPLTSDRPRRCDVIIYHSPSAPDQLYIKRVVAIGGDTVAFTQGSVQVNKVPACPTVLHGDATPLLNSNPQTVTVPSGMYFVVGDNLLESADSRMSGPIGRSGIVGYIPG